MFSISDFLTPAEIAEVDQYEAQLKTSVESAIDVLADSGSPGGAVEVAFFAAILSSGISQGQLASIAAYLLIAEMNRRVAANE